VGRLHVACPTLRRGVLRDAASARARDRGNLQSTAGGERICPMSHRAFVGSLAATFACWWVAFAFHPHDRSDWLLENALTLIAVALLAVTYRRFPFSRVSYALMFVFLCLHTVGAHYTYSEVPYDAWWQALFGSTLNEHFGWERNHYDRWIHFAYGLLLVYPVREVYLRIAGVRGFWSYFLPLDLTMSTSMLYELIEWAAALVFGGDLGTAYLGTQGDVWDAHKDMALASLGALLSTFAIALFSLRAERDFAYEWIESLRVKIPEPPGE
jgi:putative membrane protein